MLQIQKRDGAVERQIITAMITSSRVIGRIASRWPKEGGLCRSTWCNLIGTWCVTYYNKYNRAPGREIVGLFEHWAQKHPDRETIKLVEKFLSSISGDYQKLKKGVNADFIIDLAGGHFDETAVYKHCRALESDLAAGDIEQAKGRISRFNSVNIGKGSGIKLSDVECMKRVLDDRRDVLFRYPGGMGRLFGSSLERDGFIAFMGPEKRGKTFLLLDLAWRAMLAGVRVAFFEIGDLSEKQIWRRFYTRACERPLKKPRSYNPIQIPTALNIDGDKCVVSHEILKVKSDLSVKEMTKKIWSIENLDMIDIFVYPNSSINVSGIKQALKEAQLRNKNIPYDLVVIDYADILANPPGFNGDSREAVNQNWKAMRRLSQEMHCLVVTATQASALSYKADQLGMEHFSEDKRKFAHVTGMIGINQKIDEKRDGVIRLNWLVLREEEFFIDRQAFAAGCLGIANPIMLSAMA